MEATRTTDNKPRSGGPLKLTIRDYEKISPKSLNLAEDIASISSKTSKPQTIWNGLRERRPRQNTGQPRKASRICKNL